jgi:pyruvate dehydrogenase E2 component (dihydrolipoamide acetyltransferase)
MAEKVLMIALSPTMETGTVVKWRKKVGDPVKSGDVLCEVETDKATMDYESSSDGVLLKILLPEGGQARVGDPIAVVGKAGEDVSGFAAEAQAAPPAAPQGVAASSGAAPAPRGAPAPVGTGARPGAGVAAPAAGGAAGGAAAVGASGGGASGSGRLRTSPLARRLAEEKGIDLAAVAGSGPGGRIVKRDLDAAGAAGSTSGAPAGGMAAAGVPVPSARPAGDRLVPASGMRKTIAKRLSESMFSAPHIYLTISALMDGLLAARTALNAGRQRKLSLNAFLLKLIAESLKRHPRVNASWTAEGILLRGSMDVGLAVALPDGLITPVVRDCGSKGIELIDAELADLVERARAGKLRPEEYAGAGFTVSNLGSFGIEEFTAIINPPGSAILAVGEIRREPVADEGDAVVVRSRMRMTLSCDHRVIDGAVGAAFLAELKASLENPVRTLL